MNITNDIDQFCIVVDEIDRSLWLDGVKIYWDMKRDERPSDFPTDAFDDYDPALYALDDLAHRYPLNEVPVEIVEGLKMYKELSQITNAYKQHVLGLLLKPPKFKAPTVSQDSQANE